MDLTALIRSEARRPRGRAALGEAVASVEADWGAEERRLVAEITSRPRRAGKLVDAFRRVAEASGRREARGRAARLTASHLAYTARYRESLAPYDRAAKLLSGAGRGGALIGKAGACLRLGRFAEAAELCRRVRRLARRLGDRALAAGADLNEAVARHEGGDPRSAIPLYRRAIEGLGEAKLASLAATARQNLANALVLLDLYEEAAPLYAEAAEELERLGARNEGARCRYNRGALLVATDRLGEADSELVAAEESFRHAGDSVHAALCRLDRGEALLRAGLRPEARRAIESARRGLRRGGPPVERARATLLLARTLVAQGDARSARRLLTRPLSLDSPRAEAERLELLGRAHGAEGRYARGRDLLEEAARAYGRRTPVNRARALLGAAFCALMENDLRSARRLLGRAKTVTRRYGLPSLAHGTAALEFALEDRAGRRRAAGAALERALDALEDVREGLGPDALRSAVLVGRERWFARAVRHLLGDAGGVEKALTLLERWRARALVDLLGDADRVAPPDERLAALRSRVAALERRVEASLSPEFLRSEGTAPTQGLLGRLTAAEREYRDLGERRLRPMPAKARKLRSIRETLPEGTLVLSLFADGDGTCLFTFDREGVRFAEHAGRAEEIDALAEELHFLLGQFTVGGEFAARHRRRIRRRTDRLLSELAARTIRPVERAIRRARRLVVVPHGRWHQVPFAALPIDGRPLVETLPLTLTPALAALGRGARRARGRPVVMTFADELAPDIGTEGRLVAAALPRAVLLEGEDARGEALVDRAPPSCLHVASHGRHRPDVPAMSGVRLADGWLRAVDLPSLPLEGSLVVLSGCETGVSAVTAGDEIHGLVRGVLAAGGSELLASLWRVDDATTARLLARFHELRAARVSAAVALASAQRELASEGLHPWYWAGFTLWSRSLD